MPIHTEATTQRTRAGAWRDEGFNNVHAGVMNVLQSEKM